MLMFIQIKTGSQSVSELCNRSETEARKESPPMNQPQLGPERGRPTN